jgi:hypothetical protein
LRIDAVELGRLDKRVRDGSRLSLRAPTRAFRVRTFFGLTAGTISASRPRSLMSVNNQTTKFTQIPRFRAIIAELPLTMAWEPEEVTIC